MKKKIAAFLLLIMCMNTTALADINVSHGVLDREFAEDRTVYYVEITGEEIPSITADGYEVLQKAARPAEKDKTIVSENVTIIKNTETGIKYRFIFEKNEKSNILVSGVKLSSDGKLTVSGSVNNDDIFKVIILKPEEKYSEKSVKWEDLTRGEMEKGVLDIAEVKSGDIKDGIILEYAFPRTAYSGNYGILITGDNSEENYYNDAVYYMSEKDLAESVQNFSQICKKEATDENIAELITFISENEKNLYLDLTYFNQLTDEGKKTAARLIFNEAGYDDPETVAQSLNKAITVAWVNDGKSLSQILEIYEENFELALYDEYKKLKSKGLVEEYESKSADENEFVKNFNTAVSISMINESEPEKVAEILENTKEYLALDGDIYKDFLDNKDLCIRALCNKNFKTVEEIEEAIKAEIKNKNDKPISNNKPSSGGSGGGYTVPSITPIQEPKEEITEKNELPFDDLINYEWAKTAIEHMYINKIISGKAETKFAPGDNVKREEFVKLIVNSFDFTDRKKTSFDDVGEEWFKEYIEKGYASGIITGVSDNKFGVGENITREDMAVIIYRAINKSGLELDIEIENTAELSDLEEVSDYAKEAVEFLVSKGAINGSNGKLHPKNYATRAEAAQMLYNVIKVR